MIKRPVRDNNSATLKQKSKVNTAKKSNNKAEPIVVTHTNAPLLTVKYLELILIELRKLTANG